VQEALARGRRAVRLASPVARRVRRDDWGRGARHQHACR
jgi:hypothetical protein